MLEDNAMENVDTLQHKSNFELCEWIYERILLREKEERIKLKNKKIKKLEETIQRYHYLTVGIVLVTGVVFAIKVL